MSPRDLMTLDLLRRMCLASALANRAGFRALDDYYVSVISDNVRRHDVDQFVDEFPVSREVLYARHSDEQLDEVIGQQAALFEQLHREPDEALHA